MVKSSGPVGANYIEGNEKLGDKDLKFRIKISRKEAKESEYWLKLLKPLNENEMGRIEKLIVEARELRKIVSSIINKLEINFQNTEFRPSKLWNLVFGI